MRKLLLPVILLTTVSFIGLMAQSPLDQILGHDHDDNSSLSTSKIISGLKEALRVGTTRAVATVGQPDGFLKNAAIKITLPPKIENVARGMRLAGMGEKVDDLEVAMNRAAEQASPAAKQIFLNALLKMTFDDARHILSGDDTAATEYFKRTCTDQLTTTFMPVVHRSMVKVGLVKKYEEVMQNPLAETVSEKEKFNLDEYIVHKTLDGLFYMLGQEEKKIRKDPIARTTSLLKEVFGKH